MSRGWRTLAVSVGVVVAVLSVSLPGALPAGVCLLVATERACAASGAVRVLSTVLVVAGVVGAPAGIWWLWRRSGRVGRSAGAAAGGLLSLFGLLLLYNAADSAWGLLLGDATVLNQGLALVASALYFGFFALSGVALTVVGGRLLLRAAPERWRPSA